MTRSDEDLMAAHVRGDKRAFDELFQRHAPAIVRFFMRSFRDLGVSEDLGQQVFLRVHRARETYDVARPFKPWLYTIAGRVRLDEWDRRRRTIEQLDEEGSPERHAGASEPEEPADPHPIHAALAQLTEPQRQILHLHRVEELTFREIGVVMSLSEGAVKLRAFRAYEKLRAIMGSPASGGQP
jgi:RNA polymerase sigma-70 factor (ECF subfamily)